MISVSRENVNLRLVITRKEDEPERRKEILEVKRARPSHARATASGR